MSFFSDDIDRYLSHPPLAILGSCKAFCAVDDLAEIVFTYVISYHRLSLTSDFENLKEYKIIL